MTTPKTADADSEMRTRRALQVAAMEHMLKALAFQLSEAINAGRGDTCDDPYRFCADEFRRLHQKYIASAKARPKDLAKGPLNDENDSNN